MSDVAIGVDVGGTKALALMVARDGRVARRGQVADAPRRGIRRRRGHGEGRSSSRSTSSASATGLDPSKVPVGIGCPGMMRRDGRLAFAPNLQTASGARPRGTAQRSRSGRSSVYCENDANCAALAEHEWGAAARASTTS